MWIRKRTESIIEVIKRLSRIAGLIAVIFLVAMMMLTVCDVFLRYFFNAPIAGSQEIIEYFMIISGFFGFALCALEGEHVKVELIVQKLPKRIQAFIDSITLILALTVLPLLVWQCFAQARYAYLEKTTATIIKIPDYPFYGAEALGCLLLLLVVVIILVKNIKKTRKV